MQSPPSYELLFSRFQSDKEWSSDEERPSNAPLSFEPNEVSHLELSIHEICHYRVGPTMWTYRRDSDKPHLDDSKPLRSPVDILGIIFDNDCIRQMQLLVMDFDYARYRQLLINEAELLHLYGRTIAPGLS